ncbi:TIGR03083 family protein [Friedmanniella luteola]|uniref:TIGR03083 family protein n=1 Tax=Friedmanniella luteola TaxID=546871 RepID=A0A1H1WVK2_9ACTN|nr:maleylpyruvate isomerase family mycothiol-dependent enzyme [Friedmanniella luteola]SDT00731.1 TIGR03083 family protein [Friedmanniella luteola]
MSDDHTTMDMAKNERSDFLRLIEGLTPAQWDAPTLCGRWSVREVAAHVLSYEELSPASAAALFIRGRFNFARINDLALQPFQASTSQQLTDRMREHQVPQGLTSALGGGIALADGMIHQQDIRRPLQIPRVIPPARVLKSLQIALRAPTLPSRRRASRVRLVATDTDWYLGHGPKVLGPAEALLMLVAGRSAAARDCSGPGLRHLFESE